MKYFLAILLLCIISCEKREQVNAYDNTEEKKAFFQKYNRDAKNATEEKIKKLTSDIAKLTDEKEKNETARELELAKKRLADGDYFQFLTEKELPLQLAWETNQDDPDIGSPEAIKGGTYHTYFASLAYPPTIRCIGKEANNSFRSEHWDFIEMALSATHPDTENPMPALADRWAISADKQTVWYHIDDRAKWSDGKEVVSADFVTAFYVYLSPYLTEPWYRTYYGEQFNGITTYGKDYLAIRLANPKPRPCFSSSIVPFQEDFYREFGPDFEERYNWRPRPTASAYQIFPEDIIKGRSITLSRVKDWWAKDLKYYRNLYNPDRLEYQLIRDMNKIFVLFQQGKLDFFPMGQPKFWYERSEMPEVFHGYIEKATFYNVYPRAPFGLYLNQAFPLLANQDIRIGLQHATNYQRVIDFDMRGDASRLHIMADGYGKFSNNQIRTREYSPELAAQSFAKAGFTMRDNDGIFKNEKGERLSFNITYAKSDFVDQIMQRLKEEAAKAGVEYKLDGLDSTAAFQKTSQKKHQICFTAWGITPPFPDSYYEHFHSKDAYEPGTKTPRVMTNNISTYANPVMDALAEKNRNAETEDLIQDTAYRMEEIIHNEALWVPGHKKDFYRCAFWRWVKWPKTFNLRNTDDPEMAHVQWIDQTVKEETLKAKRDGKTFPEVNRVYDDYRIK